MPSVSESYLRISEEQTYSLHPVMMNLLHPEEEKLFFFSYRYRVISNK